MQRRQNGTFGCREGKIPGKTALLGAERTKSLEKTALLGAERAKREQNPWKNSTSREKIYCVNSYSCRTSENYFLVCIGYVRSLWPSALGRGPLLGLPAPPILDTPSEAFPLASDTLSGVLGHLTL